MKGLFPYVSVLHLHCGLLGRIFLWSWSAFAKILHSKLMNDQDLLRVKNSLRYFLMKFKEEE